MNLRLLLIGVFVAVLAAVGWRLQADHKTKPAKGRDDVAAVQIITPRIGPAEVTITAVGTLQSHHSVAVRPQVSGLLTAVGFGEGSEVKAGALLFEIDTAPYRAALAQARAAQARDAANLAAAESQLARIKPLAEKDYATPQELDTARAAVNAQRALVQADAAAVEAAAVNLSRTQIRAPIGGRTGKLAVRTGNLVTPGDSEPLVTINALDRMDAVLALAPTDFNRVRQAANGQQGDLLVRVAADLTGPVVECRLNVLDNSTDAASGTVQVKALCPNAGQQLWPGSFVQGTVVLAVEPKALLLPESAVQSGAEGPYVWLVQDDQTVQLKTVQVDRALGEQVVVRGLKGDERLVGKVPRNLNPGMKVKAAEEPAPAAGAETGKGRPRGPDKNAAP